MEIGLIYSGKDPRQKKARDFVRKFVQERGILARIMENECEVDSPTVIINGRALKDQRKTPRETKPGMYPSIQDIAKALEQQVWCL